MQTTGLNMVGNETQNIQETGKKMVDNGIPTTEKTAVDVGVQNPTNLPKRQD